MLIIPDRAPTNLQTLPNSIIDRAIRNNNIASLTESRNNTGNCREGLRINNTTFRAKARRDVRLRLHVYILSAIELRRSARSNTVCSKSLNGLFFNLLVADEVVEVVGGEVRYGPAVGEFHFRSCWSAPVSSNHTAEPNVESIPNNDRQFLIIGFFERGLGGDKRFRSPFVNEVIDLLFSRRQYSILSRVFGKLPPLQSASRNCHYGSNTKAREGIE